MKTFKEYLAESKKVYSFKAKVAGELPENFQAEFKTKLDRCGVITLEKTTTPIQKLPMDFPDRTNCEVHIFEVICEYPITAPEIAKDINDLGITESDVRVRGVGEDDHNEDGALTENDPGKIKHKNYFGDDFNKGFLKDLEKTSKAQKKENGQGEYKLPKGKTDKAGTKSALGS